MQLHCPWKKDVKYIDDELEICSNESNEEVSDKETSNA